MKKFIAVLNTIHTVKEFIEDIIEKVVAKVKKEEPRQKSRSGLVLGVLGLIFAPLFPLVTYALSATGMALSSGGKTRRKSKSGIALNTVALAFAAINSVIAIVIAVMHYNGKKIPLIDRD